MACREFEMGRVRMMFNPFLCVSAREINMNLILLSCFILV